MTNEEMDSVEKMLTRFIVKSVKGVKKDYFRKMWVIYKSENSLQSITATKEKSRLTADSDESTFCTGSCAVCLKANICEAMDNLTDRQAFVIEKLYKDRYTEDEISTLLGISQQAVSYHKTEAIKKLKKILSKEHTEALS